MVLGMTREKALCVGAVIESENNEDPGELAELCGKI